MIYFYFRSDESFQKLMLFSVLSFAIANTIYMIYPNGIFLRRYFLHCGQYLGSLGRVYISQGYAYQFSSQPARTDVNSNAPINRKLSPFRKVWIVRSSAVLMVIICASTVFENSTPSSMLFCPVESVFCSTSRYIVAEPRNPFSHSKANRPMRSKC